MRRRFLNPYINYIVDPTAPNLIIYTTTDNLKIEVSSTSFGNAELLQNDYSNGKGVLLFKNEVEIVDGFEYCTTLKTIHLPESVTSIGSFEGCINLELINIPDGVKILQNFLNCWMLKLIQLPEGLEYIYQYAFKGSGLINIKIPDSVTNTTIGLFLECTDLLSIIFGDGISSLKKNVCSGCSSLSEITIGKSVTEIADTSFKECVNLYKINFRCESVENWFSSEDFSNLKSTITDITFDNTVKSINEKAINSFINLERVNIGSEVITIGANAFNNCRKLNNITFGKNSNLQTIGLYAFYAVGTESTNLFNITLPDTVISIGQYAFSNITNLLQINIPINLTKLQNGVFNECSNLKTMLLPEGLKEIDSKVFYKATSLKKLTIPSTLTNIGTSSFFKVSLDEIIIADINNYLNITYDGSYPAENPVKHFKNKDGSEITTLNISANVSVIPPYAFNSVENTLTKTIIFEADSITEIGDYAFQNFANTLTYKWKGKTHHSDISNLRRIGDYAFYGCKNIITLQQNILAYLGAWTLGTTTSIKCYDIGQYAFANCSFNTSSLAVYAYYICPYAFYNCKIKPDQLLFEHLILGHFNYEKEAQTVISDYAFNTTTFSHILVLNRTVPIINTSNTFNMGSVNWIYVPQALGVKNAYESGWGYSGDKFEKFNLNELYNNILP